MSQPYEGDSTAVNPAGLTGRNTAAAGGNGIGVLGTSVNGEAIHGETNSTAFAAIAGIELNAASNIAAVYGEQRGKGPGVFGTSQGYEGVHGETTSNTAAAVGAINKGTGGAAFYGISQGGEGVHGETSSTTFAAVAGYELNAASNIAAVYGEQRGNGPGVFGLAKGNGAGVFGTSQGYEGVHGETTSNTAAAVGAINKGTGGAAFYGISQGGEGVHGETSSATAAGVAGFALNANGTGAGVYGESRGQGPAGFFKGNVVVTGDVLLVNADCAEEFEVTGADASPGTVMALGPSGALVPSEEAYSKKVVGIVSGAGGFKPAIILDRQGPALGRAPIALIGKVGVKVDAQYGSVEPGDLLTSSPTPGHAMKVTDARRAFGSVIGKALGTVTSGQSIVTALVVRQ